MVAISIVRTHWRARSSALLQSVESGIPRIMIGWMLVALGACGLRIAISPWAAPARASRPSCPMRWYWRSRHVDVPRPSLVQGCG